MIDKEYQNVSLDKRQDSGGWAELADHNRRPLLGCASAFTTVLGLERLLFHQGTSIFVVRLAYRQNVLAFGQNHPVCQHFE